MGSNGQLKHVVVLGAGFGGLTFCDHFEHPNARVTLVDRTNHHLFQPLLYQVAMAGLSAPDIAQPIRSILSRKPRLEVLMDRVSGIDLAAKTVRCEHNVLKFDYLVIALGGVTSYFGHTEWEQMAHGLKTLDDALTIRRDVLYAFERAENERDPEQQRRLMTIVVVGGGATGVELAGACAELAFRVLRRDFDRIDPRKAKVILIEGSELILTQFTPDLSESARRQLEKLGVTVRTNTRVAQIDKGCVTLKDGEKLYAETIIWAAGVRAHPLAGQLGVPVDRGGRLSVEPDLSLPGHPDIYAIGDICSVQQKNGAPVPGVAPAAMQMARYVSRVVKAKLNGQDAAGPGAFEYKDKGTLATIGRSAGVAQVGKLKLTGFSAWLAWLFVHLIFLIGFRNKVAVLFSWAYSYFSYKLGARIITGLPHPSEAAREEARTPAERI